MGCTNLIVKGAFFMVINVSFSRVKILESKDSKWVSSLPETFSVTTLLSGTTKGLTFKLCGAMGVSIILSLLGSITGPPQLNEYPVDPVGVDIINPSDQYEVRYSELIVVSTLIIEVVFFLLTATSFRAKFKGVISLFDGLVSIDNKERSER